MLKKRHLISKGIPKVSRQEEVKMIEKLETPWLQQEGVHVDDTRKFKDATPILNNKALSQKNFREIL